MRKDAIWLVLSLSVAACGEESEVTGNAPGPEQGGSTKGPDAGSRLDASAPVAPRKDAAVTDKLDARVPGTTETGNCDTALEITVRDFTEAHPDFETFGASVKGIVKAELGPDKKPVYASTGATAATSGPAAFRQWYTDVEGVNLRLPYKIEFVEQSPGVFVYDNSKFFPIDEQGFGNGPKKAGISLPIFGNVGGGDVPDHNFLFTSEAHTVFRYRGGEKFTFRGDDDMWIFLNGKLAIDLGGTHSALSATVDLDADAAKLGLTKGNSYAMDIFHAERHTDESNYRIETTIDLSCIENVEVPFI
jgi:fibro-slime domain-containing protein